MIETPNYKLQKYELDDAANLADGYNNSMDILDTVLQQQSEDISDYFPVETANIGNGQVTENKLATAAVTETKIATGAVTSGKIAASYIDSTPTEDSTNLVTSGAVYQAIEEAELKPPTDKLLIFGDSWANPTTSYYYDWGQKVATKMHVEVANYGDGGALINSTSTNTANSVTAQVNKAATEEQDPSAVKYVLVVAGINDLASTTFNAAAYINACRSLYNLIEEKFPNAKIVHMQNCCQVLSGTEASYYRVMNLYKNLSSFKKNLGSQYYSYLCTLLLSTSDNYISDNLHLSQDGNNLMVQAILYAFGFGSYVSTRHLNGGGSLSNFVISDINTVNLYVYNVPKANTVVTDLTILPELETLIRANSYFNFVSLSAAGASQYEGVKLISFFADVNNATANITGQVFNGTNQNFAADFIFQI